MATKLSGRLLSLAKDIGIGNPEEVDTFAFADMLSPDFTELDGQHYRFEFRWHVFSELVAWRSTMYLRPAIARGSSADDSWAASGSTSRMRSSPATTASSSDPQETRLARTTSILIRGGSAAPLAPGFLMPSTSRNRFLAPSFMAKLRFWGYHLERLNLQRDSSMTNIQVDNALEESTSSQTCRRWKQAISGESRPNPTLWTGLNLPDSLAPGGDFEKILDQNVINLSVPSNLDFSAPVHCRILLSLRVEATVADHTILLSKGLIDTIPTEEALASVLAVELAHIQLGHRLDTRYAFSDRMMFANTQTYENIRLVHTPADDQAATQEPRIVTSISSGWSET